MSLQKGALALLVPLFMAPMMLMGGDESTAATATSITGVPGEYVAVVLRAGSVCSEITPSLIASQIKHESSFNPEAVSSAGAQGIAQFMPATWQSVGMDGDGDGAADVLNPIDAIWTQGNYMCNQVTLIKDLIAAGSVSGDVVELALAAYNAGLGTVQSAGGMPDISSVHSYVSSIIQDAAAFIVTGGGGSGATQSADSLDPGMTYSANLPEESASMHDPTPGAHGQAVVTPRLYTLINDVMINYPQIVNAALYCWDAHPFNPTSDHPRGRACDIPFYGCTFGDASRAADPVTGLKAGNAAANWLVNNAQRYGIHYVIWQGRIWQANNGWQIYTGAPGSDPSNCGGGHYDHIHVSVY